MTNTISKYIKQFAILASILMIAVIAIPMVAAETNYEYYCDEAQSSTTDITLSDFCGAEIEIIDGLPFIVFDTNYKQCFDATEICDETYAEIKELFTELDIAIANYNQASKDELPTYEYAEEIDAITKELAKLGIEFELQRIIELEAVVDPICPDEFEDLYEEINELLTELDALILSHNEAYKAGDMDAVYEYGQEIDEIVQELGELGVYIGIEQNSPKISPLKIPIPPSKVLDLFLRLMTLLGILATVEHIFEAAGFDLWDPTFAFCEVIVNSAIMGNMIVIIDHNIYLPSPHPVSIEDIDIIIYARDVECGEEHYVFLGWFVKQIGNRRYYKAYHVGDIDSPWGQTYTSCTFDVNSLKEGPRINLKNAMLDHHGEMNVFIFTNGDGLEIRSSILTLNYT